MCLTISMARTKEFKKNKEFTVYKVIRFDGYSLVAPSRIKKYSVGRPVKARDPMKSSYLRDYESLNGECVHAYVNKKIAMEKWEVDRHSDRLLVECQTVGKNVVAVGQESDGDIGLTQLTLTKANVQKALIEKLQIKNVKLFDFYISIGQPKKKNG